jgi:glycosyltransferase involved in cell wall biosynthesis
MPKITITVPLFNKRATIIRSLDSIAAQTMPDFEVIVVDDGSTDGGGALVEQFPDRRVRLISQANQGPGVARNRGAASGSGELLAFLDADDEWLPDFLQHSVGALKTNPSAHAAISGYFEYPANISSEEYWRSRGLKDGLFQAVPNTPARTVLDLLRFTAPWSTVLRRQTFLDLGGFFDQEKSTYGEDTYLWLNLFMNHCVHISLVPRVKFHREDSALSANLGTCRPVEPFLSHSEDLIAGCPPELRKLLANVVQARSLKTACVLGFWGNWREAGRIRKKHWNKSVFQHQLAIPALIAGTPFAPFVGHAWKALFGPPRSRAA